MILHIINNSTTILNFTVGFEQISKNVLMNENVKEI